MAKDIFAAWAGIVILCAALLAASWVATRAFKRRRRLAHNRLVLRYLLAAGLAVVGFSAFGLISTYADSTDKSIAPDAPNPPMMVPEGS